MNTIKVTRTANEGIRALTDRPVPARYAKAARSLTRDDNLTDVYWLAKKLHLNASKLALRAIAAFPEA